MSSNIGECDGCPKTDVELFSVERMNLCADCRDKELEAIEASRNDHKNSPQVNQVLEFSRKQDAGIKLSADVFNAETVSFVTLKAAIDNDPEIPSDQKNHRFMQEIQTRVEALDKAIFDAEKTLMEQKNQRHAWITQRQQFIGKLREDERAKYKQFDVSYQPSTKLPKAVKTTQPAKPRAKSLNMSKLTEVCKKYDLPRDTVRSIMVSRNMNEEDAALTLAKMMGKVS